MFLYQPNEYVAAIATKNKSSEVIGYAICKIGLPNHEADRIHTYDIGKSDRNIACFAPSIADNWQGKGIGEMLFTEVKYALKAKGVEAITLWGGVQQSNSRAIRYYEKLGFCRLGNFEFKGNNYDMIIYLQS